MKRFRHRNADRSQAIKIISLKILGFALVLVVIFMALPAKLFRRAGTSESSDSVASSTAPTQPAAGGGLFRDIVDDRTLASGELVRTEEGGATTFEGDIQYVAKKPVVEDSDSKSDRMLEQTRAPEPVAKVDRSSEQLLGVGRATESELSSLSFSSVGDGLSDSVLGTNGFGNNGLGNSGIDAPQLKVNDVTHAIKGSHDYAAWAPSLHQGELPAAFGKWKIAKIELASMKLFGSLKIFSGKNYPTVKQLGAFDVKTRNPSDAEKRLIARLPAVQAKQRLFVLQEDRITGSGVSTKLPLLLSNQSPVVVSPVLASASCQKCHNAKVGDLLGAFVVSLTNVDSNANIKSLINELAQ